MEDSHLGLWAWPTNYSWPTFQCFCAGTSLFICKFIYYFKLKATFCKCVLTFITNLDNRMDNWEL